MFRKAILPACLIVFGLTLVAIVPAQDLDDRAVPDRYPPPSSANPSSSPAQVEYDLYGNPIRRSGAGGARTAQAVHALPGRSGLPSRTSAGHEHPPAQHGSQIVLAADWSAGHKMRGQSHRRSDASTSPRSESGDGSLQDRLHTLRESLGLERREPTPARADQPAYATAPRSVPQAAARGTLRQPSQQPSRQGPTPAGADGRSRSNHSRLSSVRSGGVNDTADELSTTTSSRRQRSEVAQRDNPDGAAGRDYHEPGDVSDVRGYDTDDALGSVHSHVTPQEPTPADAEPSEPRAIHVNEPLAIGDHSAEPAGPHSPTPSTGQSLDADVLLSMKGPQLRARATGPRRIIVGQPAEFKVVMVNDGDVAANDVSVSLHLPTWAEVASTEATSGRTPKNENAGEEHPLTWRINQLPARDSEELTIKVVPRRSQPLDLAVRWTYAHAGLNTRVVVEEPMLHMVISGPSEAIYGQTKLYNLTVSNPGTGDAKDVLISLLPLEGKQEAAVSRKLGTIRAGETKTLPIELAAGKAGMLLVKAKATGDGGLTADASKEVLVRRAVLEIETVAPEAQYAGTPAAYAIKVVNNGDATAEDVAITAVLPPAAEFKEGSDGAQWLQKEGRVRWSLGAVPSGQQRLVTMRCDLHSAGINRVRAMAQDNTDLLAVKDAETNVVARADLKLYVSDPQKPVPVGEVTTYEMRIVNQGTEAAEAVEAVAFFSEGIEPVAVEGGKHELARGQVIFNTIDRIEAGGELVLQVRAKAERAGNHVFRAEVLCRSLGTKLAAEETTHYYGKNLDGVVGRSARPTDRTASRPGYLSHGPAAATPVSPVAPAKIEVPAE